MSFLLRHSPNLREQIIGESRSTHGFPYNLLAQIRGMTGVIP